MPTPRAPSSCKVYTPEILAASMVQAILDHSRSSWLEPCAGPGVFLRVLRDAGVSAKSITAIDLDLKPSLEDSFAQTIRGMDFLGWAQATKQRFDKIVANPPYVSLRRLSLSLRETAITIRGPRGEAVTRRSNTWYAFLCASMSLLQPRGSICFVLPAAWEYAHYASALRKHMPTYFGHFEVHRSQKPLFEMVQDGCFVIIGRNFGCKSESVSYFEHRSITELVAALEKKSSDTRSSCNRVANSKRNLPRQHGLYRLGDVVDIRIGGVTGDSDYFLLKENQRKNLRLPASSLVPVITKARHLVACMIGKNEWEALRKRNERVWLFRPPSRLLLHPSVRAYLRRSFLKGGCRRTRYKVRTREPWHWTELPSRVHGFISGMSGTGPWIAFNKMAKLNATNTLYAVEFRGSQSSEERAAIALSLLTSQGQESLEAIQRIYADRLKKYEPGDLMNVSLPRPQRIKGSATRYREAITALLSGEVQKATRIADGWCKGIRVQFPRRKSEFESHS
jgi:adenine-specific DNA-methyltransferase